jgi:AcrR family transcriptional regulator
MVFRAVFVNATGMGVTDMTALRALSKGEQTRQRLLDLAEEAVVTKGFAATSIDELIAAAGITKSGFFYHFCDKNDLAKALIERFLERDEAIYQKLSAQAANLTEDPLEEFLIFLKLMADMFQDLPNGHPGCLSATYAYQDSLFNAEVRALNVQAIAAWRTRFRARLVDIAKKYPPKIPIDLDGLGDMVMVVADGGIVMSKGLRQPSLLPQQVLVFRSLVRMLFQGA